MPYDKERIQDLIVKARNAREKSYSPYSKFRVGAVLVTVEEKEYTGCNVENVAYGSTTCAEVCAIVKAVSNGDQAFKAVVITGDLVDDFLHPCGNCRTVLAEFGDMDVYMTKQEGDEYKYQRLSELFPGSFAKMTQSLKENV